MTPEQFDHIREGIHLIFPIAEVWKIDTLDDEDCVIETIIYAYTVVDNKYYSAESSEYYTDPAYTICELLMNQIIASIAQKGGDHE